MRLKDSLVVQSSSFHYLKFKFEIIYDSHRQSTKTPRVDKVLRGPRGSHDGVHVRSCISQPHSSLNCAITGIDVGGSRGLSVTNMTNTAASPRRTCWTCRTSGVTCVEQKNVQFEQQPPRAVSGRCNVRPWKHRDQSCQKNTRQSKKECLVVYDTVEH